MAYGYIDPFRHECCNDQSPFPNNTSHEPIYLKKIFHFSFRFPSAWLIALVLFFLTIKVPPSSRKAPLARRGITIVSAVVVGQ